MVDAAISRVQLRDLACLGRFAPAAAGGAGFRRRCASPRRSLVAATGSGERPPRRPRAASSRPGTGDLVASTI
jgi:hypothetical protein